MGWWWHAMKASGRPVAAAEANERAIEQGEIVR